MSTTTQELNKKSYLGDVERVRRLALVLVGATVLFTLLGYVLLFANVSARLLIEWGFRGQDGIPSIPAVPIGALLLSRHPNNRIGWLFVLVGLGSGVQHFLSEYSQFSASMPGRVWAAWFTGWIWVVLQVSILLILLNFPDGKPPSPRWRWVGVVGCAAGLLTVLIIALAPGSLAGQQLQNPIAGPGSLATYEVLFGPVTGVLMLSLLAAGISLVVRYRRSGSEVRQQIKWFAFFAAAAGVFNLLAVFLADFRVFSFFAIVAITSLPVAAGVAILKYRLYDIDVVINKTLVFGALAAFITSVYIAIVVGLGALLGSAGNPNIGLSIAATAIVAIAFSPVKSWVQGLANRLVYGQRLSPYEVMSNLAKTVAAAESPVAVLKAIAQTAATGTNAERATVVLTRGEREPISSTFPDGEGDTKTSGERFDIAHRGETLGYLELVKRTGDAVTPHDKALCEDLVGQAGLGLHNASLVLELRARLDEISAQAQDLESSRSRIVSARDDSRRRLERDISLGPRTGLDQMSERLDEVSGVMVSDSSRAAVLLEEIGREATSTLDQLRELARGIYPPLLADKGVVAALDAHVRKQALDVEIHADGLRDVRFEDDVEACVFFCAVDILASTTGPARFELKTEEANLRFTATPHSDPNSLRSLRDRVESLGGELRADENEHALTGLIPVTPRVPVPS